MLNKFKNALLLLAALTLPFGNIAHSSQVSDVNLASGLSGTAFRSELNDILAALNTVHKGSSLPGSAAAGTVWVDDSGGATAWVVKLYDGTDSITIGTFNTSSNTFTPAGQVATFANAVTNSTGNFTIDSTDFGKIKKVNATSGNITASISANSGLGSSWYAIVQKTDSTSNTVTIDPNSTETINGSSTYVLKYQYEGAVVIKDSSNFIALPFGNINVVKVSSDDTTPGFLEDKITATSPIALATANGGGNETRGISLTLATDPGLENSSGLRVKAGTGIVRNSSGVNVDVGTTANKIVQLNGSAQLPAVSGALLTNLPSAGFNSMQVFTGSGTWNRPSGVTKVLVFVTGGGGGAGTRGNQSTNGAGGGAGGTCINFVDVSAISSVTVTVGAGGTGNPSAGGSNPTGNSGGNSSFGSHCTGGGGAGGQGVSGAVGGVGGGFANGTIHMSGGTGHSSVDDVALVGRGGESFWGPGYAGSSAPSTGANWGSGGNGGSGTGGTGGGGIVWVLEFK